MTFDYIRAIDPPTQDEPDAPLQPVVSRPAAVDDAQLDRLVARTLHDHGADASPVEPSRSESEVPSFMGVPLACTSLEPPPPEAPACVERPRIPRGWAAPGVMTMALAVVATLVFGAFVVMR